MSGDVSLGTLVGAVYATNISLGIIIFLLFAILRAIKERR